MKKETRNLILAFLMGVTSSLISESIFDLKTVIVPWVINNLGTACIVLALVLTLGYVVMRD